VTTAGALNPESLDEMFAALSTSSSCATPTSSESLIATLLYGTPPLAIVLNQYSTPLAYGLAGSTMAPQPLVVAKTVSGATTTLSVTSGSIAAAGYNCAVIGALDNETEEEGGGEVAGGATFTSFPISAPPPPPTPPAAVASSAPPAPAPAPPALSIGKLKPVTLKAGKSQSVRVKVANSGITGTGMGSLRVKAPKGVVVKPERQQIPALAPGKSWTLTVRVQLTAKAKKKSTLSLTAAASGVTASGSLAVTLKG
jgi:NPCBM-associated, NEW3 domain of alpha-galactosidase